MKQKVMGQTEAATFENGDDFNKHQTPEKSQHLNISYL
jgi:hypothetical protein